MKAFIAGLAVTFLTVVMLPVVLLGGDAPTDAGPCGVTVDTDHHAVILTTIRTVESGGNYQTRISSATASGAYAFINSSWRHYAAHAGVDVDTYPSAWMAPPADQDAAATVYVNEILANHGGRIEIIPIAWYLPSAIGNDAHMDVVPAIGANTLTPRQYQARWMAQYERELARTGLTSDEHVTARATIGSPPADTTGPATTTTSVTPTPSSCVGSAITPIGGDWSLPGPRNLLDDDPDAINGPHHDYPAWDWLIPTNTPIYAVRGGRVATIHNWPHNWWARGCGQTGGRSCSRCGVGLTIADDTGHRWTYCHGTTLLVALGDTVTAGQQVLWSGNTGRSGTPHLHLEIRTDNLQRCPQPLIRSLYHDGIGLDPATLPTNGCSF